MEVIKEALDQCVKIKYRRRICLSHYNEPLMDNRIIEISEMVKSYNRFLIYLVTNGDFLTKELASELDRLLDSIFISLYDNNLERKVWVESLFKKTEVNIVGRHSQTHFIPPIRRHTRIPGCRTNRLIINHRRQYLLCCEDMIGNFDLGKFPDISLHDFWFGKRRREILRNRNSQPYCSTCPRIKPWI